nr:uncharacterized protein LOC113818929 isoform X1 [Penaeus vannamei]
MEYPTKEKLQLDAHPLPSAPSAANPREENTCCCGCSWRTGAITIAILYLLANLSIGGFLIVLLSMDGRPGRHDRVPTLIAIVTTGIAIIFILLLLRGAVKRRPPFLLAWMCWEGLNIGLSAVVVAITLFTLGMSACIGALAFAIRCWCFFVVFTYRKTLIAQPPKREANNAPA